MEAAKPDPSARIVPTALSLFSGIGGLDLGFETAGFRIIGTSESDPDARRSLAANRDWPHLAPHDVAELVDAELPFDEVDIILGAPPCQPFSKAAQWHSGSRSGLDDDRGLLIFSVIDLIERLTPKVVVLENVEGFVRGETSVLAPLTDALPELEKATGYSYEIEYQLLDAHHYGVPQRRKRAFVIVSRMGSLEWPAPLSEKDRPVAWDAIGDIHVADPPAPVGKWAELLASIPEGHNYQWLTNRGGGEPLFGYRTRFWQFLLKLAKDGPAWTIAAQPGPSTGPFHWDSRPLASQEMLRLQGFPKDWSVLGDRRTQVRQIGNATPPPVAEAVARSVSRLLGFGNGSALSLALRRGGEIPAPEPVAPLPDSFADMINESIPDHPGTGRGPSPRRDLQAQVVSGG